MRHASQGRGCRSVRQPSASPPAPSDATCARPQPRPATLSSCRLHELTWAFLRAYPRAPHHGPQFSRDGTCHEATPEDEAFLKEAAAGASARADGSDLVEAARLANRTAGAYAGQAFSIERPDASDGAQPAAVLSRWADGALGSERRASGAELARLAEAEAEAVRQRDSAAGEAESRTEEAGDEGASIDGGAGSSGAGAPSSDDADAQPQPSDSDSEPSTQEKAGSV